MKRRELLDHLRRHGCALDREGGRHSIYRNEVSRKQAPVPRQSEIDNRLARKICEQLGIPDLRCVFGQSPHPNGEFGNVTLLDSSY